ncbi:MAG: DNA topoisomerase [Bifidobacterium longum]
MRLFVAEKHSVGQAIAAALGGGRSREGYIETADGLVTWAQGHLVDLAMPADYKGRGWDKWSMESLPIDPTPGWQWEVSHESGATKQYRIVAGLMARADVTSLVNACDPDREGEAIFRRIVAHARVRKPEARLWVASLEEDAIRQAVDVMKPESEYQGLADSAMIRAKADWLIGMNASRAYSLVYDAHFAVGRVQTPTLDMIVDRDRRIEAHKPTPFWKIIADMGGWHLVSEQFDDKHQAARMLDEASRPGARFDIVKADRTRRHDKPPTLYDLTGLQKDMSRLHGLTAARTLAALQSLYEKKLTTYPRTDSKYITQDDLDTLRRLTDGDRLVDGFVSDPSVLPASPRLELTVADDKVAGHTAILPTMQADAAALDELGDDERLVLTRVVRRMWEAIGDDHVHDVTTVNARFAMPDGTAAKFTAHADETVTPGWKGIEHAPEDHGDDDEDARHDVIPVNLTAPAALTPAGGVRLREGETKPPARFTEATLLNAMEHASRYLEDEDLKAALDDDESHSGGIGTPATRADVIEKLVRTKYVERKGKQLRSTEQGRSLIDVVAPRLKDVELTASMERKLSAVERDGADPMQVEQEFRELARRIPDDAQRDKQADRVQTRERKAKESFGPCPRCGEQVVKTGRMWQCSSNKSEKQADGTWANVAGCGWKLFPKIAGKTLTDANVRQLLAGRKLHLKGFVSKTGKNFDADLVADRDRGARFAFGDRKGSQG